MTKSTASDESDFWTDDELLECVSVLQELKDVMTICFQAPSGRQFKFDSGQFITLELPVPGGPLYRTYTISSSPTRPMSITVTVKAQEDSIGSRWILDNMYPGMRIKAMGPAGLFTTRQHPSRKYLFISAGSGITPMMSMTTEMYDIGRRPDVIFVNWSRRPSEIIFRERLEHMASRIEGIDIKWVVEETDPFRPWTGYMGRFNQLTLGLIAPDYLEREVFCCGPEPFMQVVREVLTILGFDMDHYHQESFHAPETVVEELVYDAANDDGLLQEDAKVEISFAESGLTVSSTETETILNVARASDITIPSGCTFGVCGTCKIKKLKGEVQMAHSGGIMDDEIEEGYILACCSYPKGDVVLEV